MNKKRILYSLSNGIFNVIEYNDIYGNVLRALASKDAIYSDTMTGDKKYELYYPYIRLYDLPNIVKNDIKNSLVLGAGCFTYPKYYISKYPDKSMDCVEIDSEIIDVAHKYFFLDDLIKEFDPNQDRLRIFQEDAYKYIINCNKKYDYIFLDVFDDSEPVKEFLSDKYIRMIKKCINNKGIFATNYIINNGKEESFYEYINILKNEFEYIYLLTINNESIFSDSNEGNVYILCTDEGLLFPFDDSILILNSKLIK